MFGTYSSNGVDTRGKICAMAGKCRYPDCVKGVVAKHLCTTHYKRLKRNGTTNLITSDEFHGMAHTPTYWCWHNMLQRCYNKNHPGYKNYGGRGIYVCRKWHFFGNFLTDMGVKPQGLTLERKNNNESYTPQNCKWATYKEQANNRHR